VRPLSDACFLTGGSGFVGGAILRHLVAEGREVRSLARSDRAAAAVADLGGIPIRGDLNGRDTLRDAMEGTDVAYHVAGVNAMCRRNNGEMFRSNVAGTRWMVEAAADAGVQRVILTSSVTAAGPGRSAYARSKGLGEVVGFATGRKRGIEVVAVRPSSVQGPGRTEGSARLLLYLLRSRHPVLVETLISIVDIDDCAESHLRAARLGEDGRSYVISGGTMSTVHMATLLAESVGRQAEFRVIPRRLAALMGMVPALIGDLWPGDAPICREALATLLADHHHDGGPAARALDFTYRPVGATLARAAQWYLTVGMI